MDPEFYFAKMFNCLENFLEMLETEKGLEEILQLYHHYWLHQDQKVRGVYIEKKHNLFGK